jgi:hypothetical protein
MQAYFLPASAAPGEIRNKIYNYVFEDDIWAPVQEKGIDLVT